MSAPTKWNVVKKAVARMSATLKPGAAPPPSFSILDDGQGGFTVVGTDAAGNQVPIPAGSATLTLASSDSTPAAYINFSTPVGMSFTASAVGPVTPAPVTLTATVTWTAAPIPAGSPFSGTAAFSVVLDAVTGVAVVAAS
jgi:hypothetical protein